MVPISRLQVNVAFLACETYGDCLKTFDLAKSGLGEILSAFEFMDGAVVNLRPPVPGNPFRGLWPPSI